MQTDRTAAIRSSVAHVLDLVPSSTFLLTAAFSELRSAVTVRFVQQVATQPPMVLIAMEKGQTISPIIRDARNFALCLLDRNERNLLRLFAQSPDQGVDAFLTVPHLTVPGGAPVPLRARGFIACEVVRHLDIEADHEVYIGMVHHAALLDSSPSKGPWPGGTGAHRPAAKHSTRKARITRVASRRRGE
jgi:flavin reductase (DIM6/NTAB) family NADH-FMN oxidoreductase RutF